MNFQLGSGFELITPWSVDFCLILNDWQACRIFLSQNFGKKNWDEILYTEDDNKKILFPPGVLRNFLHDAHPRCSWEVRRPCWLKIANYLDAEVSSTILWNIFYCFSTFGDFSTVTTAIFDHRWSLNISKNKMFSNNMLTNKIFTNKIKNKH